jgi:hypothetical protein
MPAIQKHTNRRIIKKKKMNIQSSNEFDEITLFPDQLAKVNAFLEKAILLPRDNTKVDKQKSLPGQGTKKRQATRK